MIERLTTAIKAQENGFLVGDTSSGRFSFIMKEFELSGSYNIDNHSVKVSIIKQPLLASCEKIEAQIRKFIEEDDPSETVRF